MFLFLEWL